MQFSKELHKNILNSRDKSSLESQISKLKLSLEQRDGDLDGKYRRGSDVVEHQLREERNNLEAELRRLKVCFPLLLPSFLMCQWPFIEIVC